MPLDEVASRRPDYRPDIPVRLCDGQTWHVRRPLVSFGLVFPEAGDPTFRKKDLGFGAAYMEKFFRFQDAATADEQINIGASMVVDLLRLNYSLDNAALAELLVYRPADPENVAMWGELFAVAMGNSFPKGDPDDDM